MAQAQRLPDSEPASLRARTVGGVGALATEISAACFKPPALKAERIKAALKRAVAEPGLLTPEQCLPKSDCYARHVIYADPTGRFTILAIVWGAGSSASRTRITPGAPMASTKMPWRRPFSPGTRPLRPHIRFAPRRVIRAIVAMPVRGLTKSTGSVIPARDLRSPSTFTASSVTTSPRT